MLPHSREKKLYVQVCYVTFEFYGQFRTLKRFWEESVIIVQQLLKHANHKKMKVSELTFINFYIGAIFLSTL